MKYTDRAELTPSEKQVCELFQQRLSYLQISEKLDISLFAVGARLRSARMRMKASEHIHVGQA